MISSLALALPLWIGDIWKTSLQTNRLHQAFGECVGFEFHTTY